MAPWLTVTDPGGIATGQPGILGNGPGVLDNFRAGDLPYTPAGGADNFNRSDAAKPGLGSEWIAPNFYISGNQALRDTVGTGDWATFLHDVGTDHWAEVDVIHGPEITDGYAAIGCRMVGDNSGTGYVWLYNPFYSYWRRTPFFDKVGQDEDAHAVVGRMQVLVLPARPVSSCVIERASGSPDAEPVRQRRADRPRHPIQAG